MADKTKPFVGFMFLELAALGSPTVYNRICEATAVSGLGITNALVDSTTFCSGAAREYIPGLADGNELTIDANYIVSSAVRRQLPQAAVNDRANIQLRLVVEQDGVVVDEEYRFEAAALSWAIVPSIDDKNTISFTAKISGEIDWIDNYVAT